MFALITAAEPEPDCICVPCRRLRELGRVYSQKQVFAARPDVPEAPFVPRGSPAMRPRRDRA